MTVTAESSGLRAEGDRLEPPRRSPLVDALMGLSLLTGHRRATSPHTDGAPPLERALYEYRWHEQEGLSGFWECFEGAATPDILRGRDVLDVGCAWGGKAIRYAELWEPRTMTGFDIPRGIYDPEVPSNFARSRGLTNCRFTVGAAEDIPFGNEEFDVVMLDDVLEHVRDPTGVVTECARVLRPGGLMLARFPSIKMVMAHHFNRALAWPALHWIASMRTWAAGFNDWLTRHPEPSFPPFAAIRPTGVTADLSGLDLGGFKRIVEARPLRLEHLALYGLPQHRRQSMPRVAQLLYEALRRLAPERFSSRVVFIARKGH